MRRHQPDETDRARDRNRGADAERNGDHHHDAGAVDVDAKRGGGVLAERERAKAGACSASRTQLASRNGRGDDEMIDAAILERAEQPERDLERGVRRGREIEDQRGRRAAKLASARPASSVTVRLARRPAMATSPPIERSAPTMPASGTANEVAPVSP